MNKKNAINMTINLLGYCCYKKESRNFRSQGSNEKSCTIKTN